MSPKKSRIATLLRTLTNLNSSSLNYITAIYCNVSSLSCVKCLSLVFPVFIFLIGLSHGSSESSSSSPNQDYRPKLSINYPGKLI